MSVVQAVRKLGGSIGRHLDGGTRVFDLVENLNVVVVPDGVVGLGGHLTHHRGTEDGREVVVSLVGHQHQTCLLGVIAICRGHVGREVIGDDDLVVVTARLEARLSLVVVHKVVVEGPRLLQCVNQVVARMNLFAAIGGDGHIVVDHGNRQRVEAAVRIVEGQQVQRAVDERDECDAKHRDLHARVGARRMKVEEREAQAPKRIGHTTTPPFLADGDAHTRPAGLVRRR